MKLKYKRVISVGIGFAIGVACCTAAQIAEKKGVKPIAVTLPIGSEKGAYVYNFKKERIRFVKTPDMKRADVDDVKAFFKELKESGDIHYNDGKQIVVNSRKSVCLGRGRLSGYAGSNLVDRLQDGKMILQDEELESGSLFMIRTSDDRCVLVQVVKREDDKLLLQWIAADSQSNIFPPVDPKADILAAGEETKVVRPKFTQRQAREKLTAMIINSPRDSSDGTLEEARRIFREGDLINERYNYLLSDAAAAGSLKYVKMLHEEGCKINECPAVEQATLAKNYDILEYFFQNGGDPYSKDEGGLDYPIVAAYYAYTNIQELIQIYTKYNGTTSMFVAAALGDIDMVRSNLARKIDINARGRGAVTALMLAARGGHTEICRLLINAGANVTMGENSVTPLLLAAKGKHYETIQLLMRHSSVSNISEVVNQIPLDDTNTTEFILSHHENPLALITNASMWINSELFYGRTEHISMYRARGFKFPFWAAARYGDMERVKELLAAKQDVNEKFKEAEGCTALQMACWGEQTNMVQFLLENGADPNVGGGDRYYPLFIAAGNNSAGIAELLLKKRANPDVRCTQGQTPLFYAAAQGCYEVFKVLLENGASPRIKAGDDPEEGFNRSIMSMTIDPRIKSLLRRRWLFF